MLSRWSFRSISLTLALPLNGSRSLLSQRNRFTFLSNKFQKPLVHAWSGLLVGPPSDDILHASMVHSMLHGARRICPAIHWFRFCSASVGPCGTASPIDVTLFTNMGCCGKINQSSATTASSTTFGSAGARVFFLLIFRNWQPQSSFRLVHY